MGRFFNKNELVIIIIIILFFDLNNFCNTALNQIISKEKLNVMLFLFLIIMIVFDVYIFYSVANSIPTAPNYYNVKESPKSNEDNTTPQAVSRRSTCQQEVDAEIRNYVNDINEIKKINCSEYRTEQNYVKIKKIILVIVSIVLITIISAGMILPGSNPLYIRAPLCIPLLTFVLVALYFAYQTSDL